MLNNFIAFLTLIAGLLFAVALEYGFDKEETRQVYLQYVENQDFEKIITGCKFQSNCDYYNNLLWTAVEYDADEIRYNIFFDEKTGRDYANKIKITRL